MPIELLIELDESELELYSGVEIVDWDELDLRRYSGVGLGYEEI